MQPMSGGLAAFEQSLDAKLADGVIALGHSLRVAQQVASFVGGERPAKRQRFTPTVQQKGNDAATQCAEIGGDCRYRTIAKNGHHGTMTIGEKRVTQAEDVAVAMAACIVDQEDSVGVGTRAVVPEHIRTPRRTSQSS